MRERSQLGQTAVISKAGNNGRLLDTTDLQQRLLQPMKALQPVSIELLVHDIPPAINDAPEKKKEGAPAGAGMYDDMM